MRKIHFFDLSSKIMQEGFAGFSLLMTSIIDAFVFGAITMIGIIIIEALIGIQLGIEVFFTIVFSYMALCLLKIIISIPLYYRIAAHRFTPFIITENDTYTIVIEKMDTTILTRYWPTGFPDLKELMDFKSSTLLANDIERILENCNKKYIFKSYQNVTFVNENYTHYYFHGNRIKKNGKLTGKRRFSIAKIYTDYTELKRMEP